MKKVFYFDQDFKQYDEERMAERDTFEINRLKRQRTPMARVLLAHKFGEGDCPCNNCSPE